MKVLMINPPIRLADEHPPNFPTGIAIITSVIRNMGHEVKVLDLNANRLSEDKIKDMDFKSPEVICIGSLVSTYKYIKWLVGIIRDKNPKVKIIVGNSLAVVDDLLMKNGVDVVVHGEGEETIEEVIRAIENKKSLSKIKGISHNGKRNPLRPPMKNIDSVPLPAYDLFPVEKYLNTPIDDATPNPDMNMVVSRGCPYNCNYCYKNFGRFYRLRSIDNVMKEINLLVNKYHVKALVFPDDNFGVNNEWLLEFCERVKPLKLEWGCMTRVDSPILNKNTLKRMKEAGCKSIGFGLESASQKILDKMNKGVKVKQMKEALEIVRKSGIRGDGSWMFGYPGETIESAKETIKFCYENNVPLWWGFTTAYPETPLWNWAVENGKIKEEDKEEYIYKLGDTQDFIVNLTDIPDKEYFALWKYGRSKINKSFKVKFYRIVEYSNVYGITGLISKVYMYTTKNLKQKLR